MKRGPTWSTSWSLGWDGGDGVTGEKEATSPKGGKRGDIRMSKVLSKVGVGSSGARRGTELDLRAGAGPVPETRARGSKLEGREEPAGVTEEPASARAEEPASARAGESASTRAGEPAGARAGVKASVEGAGVDRIEPESGIATIGFAVGGEGVK